MSASEISSTIAAMMRAYDDQDRRSFLGVFTSDVRLRTHMIDGSVKEFVGRDAIEAASERGLTQKPNLIRHLVLTPSVEFTSSVEAIARYHQLYIRIGGSPAIAGAGDYHDRFRREDGCWRLYERDHYFLTPPPER
jgi:uncharacterized protein (TIGR02246 family)